jgi:lipoprotein-releasing system permease protein
MIISIGVSRGFQIAVKEKVAGFEGHIRVSTFDYNQSFELTPISADAKLLNEIEKINEVKKINRFAIKIGIIKHNGLVEGAIFKGVDSIYDWTFFNKYLKKGFLPNITDTVTSTEILLSEALASKMQINTGESILMYFVQDPPRVRKYVVSGIYNTGFEEFDANYLIGDIRQIQKLNKWNDDQVSGLEIHLKDFYTSDITNQKLYKILNFDIKSETLAQRYPMIIDWLNLLDNNVYFIIGLMILISGITIIATMLILILEKTNLIGILKAMGTTNKSIRQIFLYRSLGIIIKGLFIGNFVGLFLGFLQKKFEIIPLDPQNYYMSTVPFDISFSIVLILNLGVLLITLLMILWPSTIIAKISPITAIRFR